MYGTSNMFIKRRTTSVKPKQKVQAKKNIMVEINSEHDLQKACVAKLKAHNMLCFCTDVFNGISFIRDIAGKSIYKQHMIAMGAKVGQPDLIVLHDGKCTFVEFKWKNGKKSPDQEATCNLLTSMGYEVLEWRTLQECIDWLMLQLGNTNEPLLDE